MMNNLKRFVVAVLSALLIIFSVSACDNRSTDFDPDLTVHYLDVGQGDSTFIELPNGQTMLIDAGENYYGEDLLRYISLLGYSKIDYLIATHPHADHIGSMAYVVTHFDIGEIYMPKVASNLYSYEALLKAIEAKGMMIKNGIAGVSILKENDLSVDIVAPEQLDEDNINNSSLVINMLYRDSGFLFLADAEHEELDQITANIKTDVLKVGHHGSDSSTSKELLERTQPQIAVISCGLDNVHGHPDPLTLALLEQYGCDIFRTDYDATVIVSTDGKRIKAEKSGYAIVRSTL
jgi:competence protein ComEC